MRFKENWSYLGTVEKCEDFSTSSDVENFGTSTYLTYKIFREATMRDWDANFYLSYIIKR